jgi:hypothetical protein
MHVGAASAQCGAVGDPSAVPPGASAWRGSAFGFGQALSASTLSKSSTLSYDPYYAVGFDLCLQWHFAPSLKTSIEQGLDLELTDSDSTTSRQKPLLSDTSLRIDTRLVTQRWGQQRSLGWNGGFEVQAPTSLASQAASLVAGTRVRLGATLVAKDILAGASAGLEGSYLRRFSRGTTVLADTPYPCLAGTSAAIDCTHLAGSTNLRDTFITKLQFQASITRGFGVELLGALQWDHANALQDATLVTDTGASVTLPDRSTTHWRDSRKLVFGVFYSVTPFLDLELSSSSQFAERGPNGILRGPFRASDTVFGLDASLDLEQLTSTVRGSTAADAPSTHP